MAASFQGSKAITEITIVLHTPAGDVRTCYPVGMVVQANIHITEYLYDGKRFSVEYN